MDRVRLPMLMRRDIMVKNSSEVFHIDAIILAGASEKGLKEFGVNKSQLRFNGKRLVETALDAVSAAGCADRIFIIGNRTELEDLAHGTWSSCRAATM